MFPRKIFTPTSVILLTFCIVSSLLGQSDAERIRPGMVVAAKQPDSPILISDVSVGTLRNGSVRVSFRQQNIGAKAIRSAAYEAMDGAGGKQVSTAFYCSSISCGIAPGADIEGGLTEEEDGFDHRRGILVRLDFVLFMDGTSWGSDRNGDSKVSLGYEKGFITVLEFARKLVNEGDEQKLAKLLSTQLSDADIAMITGSSDNKWIKGYRFGYNLTMGSLGYAKNCYGRARCSGLGGLENELEKFEKTVADVVR